MPRHDEIGRTLPQSAAVVTNVSDKNVAMFYFL
jgi:hypothetical protein